MNTPTPHADLVKELTDAIPGAPAPYSILLAQAVITIAKLQQQNIAWLADKTRLSTLCDKWNLDADQMREDNKRLAGELDAIKKQEPVAFINDAQIDEFLQDYEMLGENEAGQDCYYTPTEGDKALIKDAIFGYFCDAPSRLYSAAGALGAQPAEVKLLTAQIEELQTMAMMQKEYKEPDDVLFGQIERAAHASHQRHKRSCGGQQFSRSDSYETHLVWAAMAAAGAQPGCISNCDTCINAWGSPANPGYCRMFYTEPQGDCGKWSSSTSNPCAAAAIGEAMP